MKHKSWLTRDERRKRVEEKIRAESDAGSRTASGEDAAMDAMVKKSIEDHGA